MTEQNHQKNPNEEQGKGKEKAGPSMLRTLCAMLAREVNVDEREKEKRDAERKMNNRVSGNPENRNASAGARHASPSSVWVRIKTALSSLRRQGSASKVRGSWVPDRRSAPSGMTTGARRKVVLATVLSLLATAIAIAATANWPFSAASEVELYDANRIEVSGGKLQLAAQKSHFDEGFGGTLRSFSEGEPWHRPAYADASAGRHDSKAEFDAGTYNEKSQEAAGGKQEAGMLTGLLVLGMLGLALVMIKKEYDYAHQTQYRDDQIEPPIGRKYHLLFLLNQTNYKAKGKQGQCCGDAKDKIRGNERFLRKDRQHQAPKAQLAAVIKEYGEGPGDLRFHEGQFIMTTPAVSR